MAQKLKKGFTIIEVVLVLAIAGLIFLMVFVALPTLQGSERDTERRQAMARVNNAVIQYQTNNNKTDNLPGKGTYAPEEGGEYPADCSSNTACRFIRDYLNSASAETNTFQDPDGKLYNLVITSNFSKGSMDYEKVNLGAESAVTTELTGDSANGYTISGTNPFSAYTIYLVPGSQCDGEFTVPAERRHFSILYRLERSGVYCLDDQSTRE